MSNLPILRQANSTSGSGAAELVVFKAPNIVGSRLRFVLKQDDDVAPFLGPSGWQSAEFTWESGDMSRDGRDLVVPIGPLVTAQIDDFTPIIVQIPTLGMDFPIIWQGITPPNHAIKVQQNRDAAAASSFPGLFLGQAQDHPSPSPQPAPPAAPVLQSPPLPTQDLPVDLPENRRLSEEPVEREGNPHDVVTDEAERTLTPNEPPSLPQPYHKKRGWWKWMVALVICVILILVFYVFRPREPIDQLPPSLEQRHAAALTAINEGRIDEATVILRRLEQAGYAPSILFLATQIDSLDFSPGLFDAPNDLEALELYERACLGRAEGVKAILDDLETSLNARIETGDVIAREIVQLILPRVRQNCQS